ncbi:MerR family transcriptional regulator [Clostridium tetanomorphum]|uniref:Methyltransferase domain-containing protein n=1 Tax=Clostridium tetanomorphum TaxID=1553 RepID=A0A923EBM8_CLOTT|nr:MerR family transcriptional regulator [Clostridium tetanomorphum]MBC2400080.1 methyltransferase domain-containing protein [Clostridium tetanomorphum]NRZ97119.1 DNA-binding transcriptional MerR regulator/ubiquinone/menaquinone biosynthesis C-methylase UbiE [Clostridium tetanomorphum]
MTTNQVCKILNITLKSLIIYEQYGIVVPKREKNNYRNYSEDDLFKLRTIILLKELGFSLKDIKNLIDKNNYGNSQFTRSLYLQLRAVERKIDELNNVKNTLKTSIDKMLEHDFKLDYDHFVDNIDISLKENKTNRISWIDMWGFDNTAIKFDKMVRDKSNDELGLFEKYDEILFEIRSRIINHGAVNVIDIGCGTGNLCGDLSEKIDILGIDQSLEMILQAKKKYNKMKFKLGNFLDKPFRKNDIDIVVTTYAFHSLNHNEKKEALNYMLDYLKDNGKIIIADFMFLNDGEREKYKNSLCDKGRQDLWNVINNKYYTNLEELKRYVSSLNYKIHSEHIVNFTWIVEIKK